jgi:catechol 2,3-dioxygenase-like lactoylglutathione lyase family enzyme
MVLERRPRTIDEPGVKAEGGEVNTHLKEGHRASLTRSRVSPGADVSFINQKAWVAVSNMVRATDFYEGKLGLSGVKDEADGSRVYECGGGTSLHVYASRALAGRGASTLATWCVTDLNRVVRELSSNGVVFEQSDQAGLITNAQGIASTSDGKIAWFKDPDGNRFAVEQ